MHNLVVSALAFFAMSVQPVGAQGARQSELVLVEAESLEETGGWVVDQQFMDLMGSPFLLAHGIGVPVPDAKGNVRFAEPGRYRVWVRTRDWVAPWKAKGSPGRFRVRVDGKTLEPLFGTKGAHWHWQNGGVVDVGREAEIALHDLTGFAGRCDAILFARDTEYEPPHGGEALAKLRGRLLGWDREPSDGGRFDLVVVGGGVAGTAASITAARLGLRVALIQDRPVLGGNGSSEVRVWPEGHINQKPYPRVGDVVGELIPKKPRGNSNAIDRQFYDDRRKLKLARAETKLTLVLEHRMNHATAKDGRIVSVIAQHTRSGKRQRIHGDLFLDSTGDGVLGALVGADFELLRTGHMGASNLWNLGAVEKNERQLECECEDEDPLSLTFTQAKGPQPFPRCPWAVDLTNAAFPGRKGSAGQWRKGDNVLSNLGQWFWESGYNRHPIDDMELVRDYNFRAMYGAWDVLKNVDGLFPEHRLKWVAYIAGKRESRRLLGDVVLEADDFRSGKKWEDEAFPCTWHIDVHTPDPRFAESGPEPFIARATESKEYRYKGPYWAPYRCLYSRNVPNLFMAGRNISVTHEALGAVRVMRTCGMMGEIVGMAASLCKKHGVDPRGIYEKHLAELKQLMKRGVGAPL